MNNEKSNCYQCKSGLLPGHNYATIIKIARKVFNNIANQTKRRPYIRSAYFKGEKIFLDKFWPHLLEKNLRDRIRRLVFFKAALELIQHSKTKPLNTTKNAAGNVAYYRFLGQASSLRFVIQIKEDLKRRQKFLMSMFGIHEK